jgi:hypothetical protein
MGLPQALFLKEPSDKVISKERTSGSPTLLGVVLPITFYKEHHMNTPPLPIVVRILIEPYPNCGPEQSSPLVESLCVSLRDLLDGSAGLRTLEAIRSMVQMGLLQFQLSTPPTLLEVTRDTLACLYKTSPEQLQRLEEQSGLPLTSALKSEPKSE